MTSETPIDGVSGHTPWQASEGGFGREWLVRDQRGWQVAHDLTERHARLIAAAPELLAVAKAIRDSRPDYDTPEEARALRDELARVIARAENR